MFYFNQHFTVVTMVTFYDMHKSNSLEQGQKIEKREKEKSFRESENKRERERERKYQFDNFS